MYDGNYLTRMKEIHQKLCREFEVELTNHPLAINPNAAHGLISLDIVCNTQNLDF